MGESKRRSESLKRAYRSQWMLSSWSGSEVTDTRRVQISRRKSDTT